MSILASSWCEDRRMIGRMHHVVVDSPGLLGVPITYESDEPRVLALDATRLSSDERHIYTDSCRTSVLPDSSSILAATGQPRRDGGP
jgi:hypothetical protein